MPDHVSPDTGRRLRDAGLAWQPAIGDWAAFQWYGSKGVPEIGLVDELHDGGIVHLRSWFSTWQGERRADGINVPQVDGPWPACTWLPSTGQLLDLLVEIGANPSMDWLADQHEWGVMTTSWAHYHVSRLEALAEAWLRVHDQKGNEGGKQ